MVTIFVVVSKRTQMIGNKVSQAVLLYDAWPTGFLLKGGQRDDSEVEVCGKVLEADVTPPCGRATAICHVLVVNLRSSRLRLHFAADLTHLNFP